MEICTHPNEWFSRDLCPEPCGSMHYHCEDCGVVTDGCHFEESVMTVSENWPSSNPPDYVVEVYYPQIRSWQRVSPVFEDEEKAWSFVETSLEPTSADIRVVRVDVTVLGGVPRPPGSRFRGPLPQ